jgi:hypothetical protein
LNPKAFRAELKRAHTQDWRTLRPGVLRAG